MLVQLTQSDKIQKKIEYFRHQRKSKHAKILKPIRRSNKLVEALKLPKIANINPRSAMNKLDQLETFINEMSIDVAFISESHESESNLLSSRFESDLFAVISNVHQRKEKGGRPAIIVKKEKYNVENITNSLIDIPWGVEVVWAILTPQNIHRECTVQKIVLGSIYSKPQSKKKNETLDHICQTYNFLNAKFGKGLYWVLAGDTNDMRLDPILHMHSSLKSVVTKTTREISGKILDNIITDLHSFYKAPDCLKPLDPDDDAKGAPSDHNIVVMEPRSVLENKPARETKEITVRPMKRSGIDLFGFWVKSQNWKEIFEEENVNKKADIFQNMLLQKLNEFLPSKTRKVCTADQPFCTDKIKRIKRKKTREYQKNRKSLKWRQLNLKYQKEIAAAKSKYYGNIVKDLKTSNVSQWYSKLKRLCSYDKNNLESIDVESLKHLSESEQAEAIADKFAKVSQEYEPVKLSDIDIPYYEKSEAPQFTPEQVKEKLQKLKVRKAVPYNDLPLCC